MEHLPSFDQFCVNEEQLQKADQSQVMKRLVKSFDQSDINVYLKGMMLELEKPIREKLSRWLSEGRFKQVILYLLKITTDEQLKLKLLNIRKELAMNPAEEESLMKAEEFNS